MTTITATPTLDAMIHHLRHPETWPAGFEWDYSYSTRCAVGLAHGLWPEDTTLSYHDLARKLGLKEGVSNEIFAGLRPPWWRRPFRFHDRQALVTAADVASALERERAT